ITISEIDGTEKKHEAFFMFARGAVTNRMDWSVCDLVLERSSDLNAQSFWTETDESALKDVIAIVGPVPVNASIYLFARTQRSGSQQLVILKLDTSDTSRRWIVTNEDLSITGVALFNAAVIQQTQHLSDFKGATDFEQSPAIAVQPDNSFYFG